MSYVLGLDMGSNSIGWALIEMNEQNKPINIKDCGCRIFQEAVEAKTRTPKNQARQLARSARRLTMRRRQRKQALLERLIQHHLLPEDENTRKNLLENIKFCDPYDLRGRALDEKLSLHEVGRALYHLNKRRGFKSNRKAEFGDFVKQHSEIAEFIADEEKKEKLTGDDGKMKIAISELRSKITVQQKRTVGEYFASIPNHNKKRGHHTERSMLEDEFHAIWSKQQTFYPNELHDGLKAEIENIIFHQRPLQLQRHLIGECQFEPGRKRAAKARLEFQEYRVLQDVNNLMILDPITLTPVKLTNTQRDKLLTKLQQQKKVSFDAIRKLFSLHENEKFNLETNNCNELLGNTTKIDLEKILGKERWSKLEEEKKLALTEDLFSFCNKAALYKRLTNYWQLDKAVAYKLATHEFENGYANLSLQAIRNILPSLRKGLRYDEACTEAGYNHSDQSVKKVTDKLENNNIPDVRNPVVEKALHEAKKLINAVIKQYGKPTKIRIEMAREMKMSRERLAKLNAEQARNRKLNELAKEALLAYGICKHENEIKGEELTKYRLWKEAKEICPYTGESISLERLIHGDVDIEHIIPFSRCLDDSYNNKTICLRAENHRKGNFTPYEAYADSSTQYEAIKSRVNHFHPAKKRKFYQQEVDLDKFVNRQLNDTQYISTAVKNYIAHLGCEVEVTKGGSTALLRGKWGLNSLLSTENVQEEKNRTDHRHHAVDAIVIGLTTRSLLKQLSDLSRQEGNLIGNEMRFKAPTPWENFRQTVAHKINQLIISHANRFRVRGQLHEETVYGYNKDKKLYLIRKDLAALETEKQIEKIHDHAVKKAIKEHIEKHDGNIKKALNGDNKPLHPNGSIIRKVRIHENLNDAGMITVEQNGVTKRFASGNNHHVEIFENINTGERTWKIISRFEAAQRSRLKQRIIFKEYPDLLSKDGWQFVMYLAINDSVSISRQNIVKIYRVQKISLNDITLQPNTHSLAEYVKGLTVALTSANATKETKKLNINTLGKIQ